MAAAHGLNNICNALAVSHVTENVQSEIPPDQDTFFFQKETEKIPSSETPDHVTICTNLSGSSLPDRLFLIFRASRSIFHVVQKLYATGFESPKL